MPTLSKYTNKKDAVEWHISDLVKMRKHGIATDSDYSDRNLDLIYTLVSLSDYSFQFHSDNDIKVTVSEVHIILGLMNKIQKCIFISNVKHIIFNMSVNGFLETVKSYLVMLAEEGLYSSNYNWNIFFGDLLSYFRCLTECKCGSSSKFKILQKRLKHSLFLAKELLNELVKHKHIICVPSLLNEVNLLLESYLEQIKRPGDVNTETTWDPYPTLHEIEENNFSQKIFYPYTNMESYLKYQFLLLKEDYLSTIRDGLIQFRNEADMEIKSKKNFNIFVYKRVKFLDLTLDPASNRKIGYQIKIEDEFQIKGARNRKAKRLLYGSLLLFSSDHFKTFFIGLVSDMKNLEEGENVLDIILVKNASENLIGSLFTMIEPSVFFEPYHQVLTCLKTLSTCNHSMNNYLISEKLDLTYPKYLTPSTVFNIFDNKVNLIHFKSWPSAIDLEMDRYQFEALKYALTNQFALIQGPPGTGKTYLGLKIVEILVENWRVWNVPPSPILVICYTNHALDQFLEGILPVTDKVVRIGGQSKSTTLIPYNLRLLKKKPFRKNESLMNLRSNIKKLISSSIATTVSYRKSAELINKNLGVLHYSNIKTVMTHSQKAFFNSEQAFFDWLLRDSINYNIHVPIESNKSFICGNEGKPVFSIEPEFIQFQKDLKSVKKVLNYHITLCDLESKLMALASQIENIRVRDLKPQEIKSLISNISDFISELTVYKFLKKRMCSPREPSKLSEEALMDMDLSSLEPHDRWCLYFMWQDQVAGQMETLFKDSIADHDDLCDFFKDACNMENYVNIQEFGTKVIGVTTTGAATYNVLLSILKPKVVVIEEAAEILEAHTVASLTKTCQHVIMIGDHYQLKPSTATYELGKEYKLDVSLFERLVKKGLPVHTLRTQRRMRPEIASLVTPLVYKCLDNHSVVYNYPDVKGINKNLFFINHSNYEQEVPDSHSHKNIQEADFLLALCTYLIRQGYDSSDITVLTTYVAQEAYMISKKVSDKVLKDVRITVVDNYQGEENKIILLSLVRSNKNNKIGYLTSRNRMCVALTRAKYGMFIVGNMDCLQKASDLWRKLCSTLKENGSYGNDLELVCQTHGNITFVSPGSDFSIIKHGGCGQICQTKLPCGHLCSKMCHGSNIDHNIFKCREKCERYCSGGHACQLFCFEDCDLCSLCHENNCTESATETKKSIKKERMKRRKKSSNSELIDGQTCVSNQSFSEDEFDLNLESLIRIDLENNFGSEQVNNGKSENFDNFESDKEKNIGSDNLNIAESNHSKSDILFSIGLDKLNNAGSNNLDSSKFDEHIIEQNTHLNSPTKSFLTNDEQSNGHNINEEHHLECEDATASKNDLYNSDLAVENESFDNQNLSSVHLSDQVLYIPNLTSNEIDLDQVCSTSRLNISSEFDLNNQALRMNRKLIRSLSNSDQEFPALTIKESNNFIASSMMNVNEDSDELLDSITYSDLQSSIKCNEPEKIKQGKNIKNEINTSTIKLPEQYTELNPGNFSYDPVFALTEDSSSSLANQSSTLVKESSNKLSDQNEINSTSLLSVCNRSENLKVKSSFTKVTDCLAVLNQDSSSNLTDQFKSLNIESFEISDDIHIKKSIDSNDAVKEKMDSDRIITLDKGTDHSFTEQKEEFSKSVDLGSIAGCEENAGENIHNISAQNEGLTKIDQNSFYKSLCHKLLECGHKCLRRCGNRPCSTKKCDVVIQRNLPCNHMNSIKCYLSQRCYAGTVIGESLQEQCKAECGEILKCGHICQGTCSSCSQGRLHEKCTQICGKTLICGHNCTMPCWEETHSCKEICNNKCIHQDCNLDCSEECNICQEKCGWKCEHFECTMPCGELCNRPPCMFACKLVLPCGHFCTGFCGEPCPPICLQCQPSNRFNVSDHRFVLIEECGHSFEWVQLLKCLKLNDISVKRCPLCGVPIWRTLRLKNFITQNNWRIRFLLRSEVPSEIFNADMKSRILETLKFLREFISEEILCNSSFQLLLQYTIDNMGLILNGAENSNQRIILKSLLFIQIYLKEMSNFTTTYDVFSMKTFHRHLIFLRINLLLNQLYNRKLTCSSEFIQFECESLKIHRMAVFYLLHNEYFQNRKKLTDKKEVEELFSKAFSFANSTRGYNLNDDLEFFSVLSNLKKLIGSSLPLTVGTELFLRSLESSLLPLFRKKQCHEGDWYLCPKGHMYQHDKLFKRNCTICN